VTAFVAPRLDPEPKPAPSPVRRLNLALQGGGSHGAFQWGVLDRLLEEDGFEIVAVTAASAGAMNAVAFACGLEEGGPAGARERLHRFWRQVNREGGKNAFGDSAIWSAAFNPSWLKHTPVYRYAEAALMSMSPHEFNPFDLNPLKEALVKSVDFERVRRAPVKLFVSATAVRAGKSRVFRQAEMRPEVVLASACLPHLFRAVEIDGEPYWDGGYLANPPLWPLFYENTPRDVLLVTVNPFRRTDTPRSPSEIMDRLNEITFNAPLVAELRAIAFVQKLIEDGLLTETGRSLYRHVLTHAITADEALADLSLASKFDTEWNFLTDLKARGRAAAETWLSTCAPHVGERSTVNLADRFL
jgi:NTE family protein